LPDSEVIKGRRRPESNQSPRDTRGTAEDVAEKVRHLAGRGSKNRADDTYGHLRTGAVRTYVSDIRQQSLVE